MSTKTNETFEFKTEVKQLLDLVVHSLYSHKEIFLRELISNAADAIDKLRFESLTNQEILGNDTEFKIKLLRDNKAGTLTVSDNGTGMDHEELVENLGTIAKSGTKAFLEQLKKGKDDIDLIGQFGVGFYASFMVADKVTVISKKAEADKAYQWSSAGEGNFEIEEIEKSGRGTDVILHLKDETKNYLEEYELRQIIRKYSDFIEHPITMDIEREEVPKDAEGKEIENAKPEKKIIEETLNSRKAIWTKAKSEVKDEEYKDFYNHISHDFHPPQKIIHYSAEGTTEFKALLYLPSKAPHDIYMPEGVKGIHLYVKRIFITDDCKKLMPEYLRFIRGVVDASDLPLNVSRELIQQDARLEKIKKNIVKKVLSELKKMKDKEYDEYVKFYQEFGPVLKEGLHYDHENKEELAELLLFETTKTTAGKYRSLEQYLSEMPKKQEDIYYINNLDKEAAKASPHLEAFKAKNYEIIYLTDHIDEWIIPAFTEYKGKQLKAIDTGDIDLDSKKDKKEKEEELTKQQKKYSSLLEAIKGTLPESIKDVRLSSRLTESASCLVGDVGAVSKQMEQMFKQMGQPVPEQKKILEINPNHPVVKAMQKTYKEDPKTKVVGEYTELLCDQAIIAEGGKLQDPLSYTKKISDLMVKAAK